MCLLDMLEGYDVVAVHLNHNWRGEESLNEAKVCENFCRMRGIKFYTETLSDDVPHNETCAREARYDFFKRCAEKFNSNVVFTAHNYDDNAETVLYRIIKGTGIEGLKGIAEHRDIFYRPLLNTTRAEIEEYCKRKGLKPNQDSSNEDTKYKRNLIRKKILPILREINPKVTDALNSLSKIASEDCTEKNKIRELLISHNIDYDKKKIDEIYEFINENKNSKSGKTLSLTKDLWLFANENGTDIITKCQKSCSEINITECGEYEFDNFVFSIKQYQLPSPTEREQLCEQSELLLREKVKFPSDKDFKALINIDKIDFTLRHRKDGDIIQPLGTKGTQKLKKYLNEKKVPNHKKDGIVLLCDGKEVLWAGGLGINDKIKVTDKPTHIIELRGKL